MGIGGYLNSPKAVRLVKDGTSLDFEHKGHRIILKNLPVTVPDTNAGVSVIELEFDGPPKYVFASYYLQLHGGKDIAKNKV